MVIWGQLALRGQAVAVMAGDDTAPTDTCVWSACGHVRFTSRVHRLVKLIRQLRQRFSTCGPREKQWALLAEEKDPHLVADCCCGAFANE